MAPLTRRPSTWATSLAAIALLSCAHGHAQPGVRWSDVLERPDAWYATGDARAIADLVLLYQRDSGGWPKDVDMTRPPAAGVEAASGSGATIDNGATTTQIRFLARVAAAMNPADADRYRAGTIRGVDYLLQAQYANGGWPQSHPPGRGYSRHITFNDNAMVNVLNVLHDLATGAPGFDFVDAGRRGRARDAVSRGVAVLLDTQIRIGGTLTAWCAQHDEVTLEPRPARSFEPASLTGSESVGIVRFLMRLPVTPRIAAAIHAAVAWLQRVRLGDGRWARFYELGTDRPIFAGRDGVVRYRVDEIERERREGYAWFGTWPQKLIEQEYPAWKKRTGQTPAP